MSEAPIRAADCFAMGYGALERMPTRMPLVSQEFGRG